jgi:TolB-like protein
LKAAIDNSKLSVNSSKLSLDRITDTLAGVQNQMAAMTRWADRFDRDHTAIIQTQSAQQRAIDELAARITRLEAQKAS